MVVASKGEINRCGDRLRDYWQAGEEGVLDQQVLEDALHVVWEFRQEFQYPMQKTAVGLRQFVKVESKAIVVAQRLKRLPQIVHKLRRMPDTKLARMEDIGGCRTILANRQEVKGVLGRIEKRWDVKRVRDYAADPKPSGYRGVHIVVERDAHRIEIQLRTPHQQSWAETVERIAGRYRLPLKDEQGPPEILTWLRLAAEGMAADEEGVDLDVEFRPRFDEARKAAADWMVRRTN